MHAHVAIAPFPVELQVHGFADRRQWAAFFDNMQDFARVAVAGVDDADVSGRPGYRSCISGLAAAERVENGAIDGHRLAFDRRDVGVTFLQIGILAKKFFRHGVVPFS
jgi:hypothetical protein